MFTTIAVQHKAGGLPPAGFFCLWDSELTFVASKWVQLVMPIPLISMLPIHDPRPSGPDDRRTRARISYADIDRVTSKGAMIVVHTSKGDQHYFSGAGFNRAFSFKTAAPEIAKALELAGFAVTMTTSALKIDHSQFGAETQHPAPGQPKSRRAWPTTSRATPGQLQAPPRPASGTVRASGAGIVRHANDRAPATVTPMGTSSWPLVTRAFVFGVAIAIAVSTAVAAVVAWSGSVAVLVSIVLGACVGYAVAVGGGALPVTVKRLIAVLATALGVAVWAYIAARQDLGITRAPLLLPGRTLAAAVAEDVRGDGWIVLFWLLALFFAARFAAADPPAPHGAAGAEPESATRRARLRAWCVGPGRWPIAATSLLAGLAASFILARAQVESGTRDPMAGLVAGECFDDTQFAVVPCHQPHEDEAYYRYTLPRGRFPGDKLLEETVSDTCDGRLAAYVGAGHADAFYDWPITPDQFEWAAGDRFAVCALSRGDNGKITGSAHQAH